MYRIDNPTAVVSRPAPAASGTPGFFTKGNPSLAIPATIVDDDFLNAQQEELMAFLTTAGITPDKTNEAQVLAAVRQMFGGAIVQTLGPGNNGLQLGEVHAGVLFFDATAGSFAVTLPDAGRPMTFRLVRVDQVWGNSVTINRHGTDLIDGAFTNIVLDGLESREIVSYPGTGTWQTFGRSQRTKTGLLAQVHFASTAAGISTTSATYQSGGLSISVVKRRASNKIRWVAAGNFSNDTTSSGPGALADMTVSYDIGAGQVPLGNPVTVGVKYPGTGTGNQIKASAVCIAEDDGTLAQSYTARMSFRSNAGDQISSNGCELYGVELWN